MEAMPSYPGVLYYRARNGDRSSGNWIPKMSSDLSSCQRDIDTIVPVVNEILIP